MFLFVFQISAIFLLVGNYCVSSYPLLENSQFIECLIDINSQKANPKYLDFEAVKLACKDISEQQSYEKCVNTCKNLILEYLESENTNDELSSGNDLGRNQNSGSLLRQKRKTNKKKKGKPNKKCPKNKRKKGKCPKKKGKPNKKCPKNKKIKRKVSQEKWKT